MKGPWALASRAYRGVLFHPGEIVCKDGANDYFLVVEQFAHLMLLLWKVVLMGLDNKQLRAFAVGAGPTENSSPTWASPLDMDDFQAVPTQIVSPLQLFLSKGKKCTNTLVWFCFRLVVQ